MKTNPFKNVQFLQSAAKLNQLPLDEGSEVAFVGRSNAGKSSAINAITGVKGLAKTSNTPGRTQLINLFVVDNNRRLVDLPGYGYAKVSIDIKERWQKTLEEYLQTRQCLKGLILIMDSRHPLKEMDQNMIYWASLGQLPVHILLTKSDKLSRSSAQQTLKLVHHYLKENSLENLITAQLFSSQNDTGLIEARGHIHYLLNKH